VTIYPRAWRFENLHWQSRCASNPLPAALLGGEERLNEVSAILAAGHIRARQLGTLNKLRETYVQAFNPLRLA
jgi:hypothetical protein